MSTYSTLLQFVSKFAKILALLLTVYLFWNLIAFSTKSESYSTKSMSEMIRQFGYLVEEHFVTTNDGYILQIHRIPPKNITHKIPILMVHGITVSAVSWILIGPKYSLPFLLADNNYDIWMLNTRGCSYSLNHTSLSTNSSKYWDFSWHEVGMYDLPATIDYILGNTSYKKLSYICHSQGCTAFYVMLASLPDYNMKIEAQIGYAAAVYLCHTSIPFLNIVSGIEKYNMLTSLRNQLGDFNLFPKVPGISNYVSKLSNLCYSSPIIFPLCNFFYESFILASIDHTDANMLHTILAHIPDGGSTKTLIHYAQAINKCEFRPYENSMSDHVEPYRINNILVPIYSFYGEYDTIQHPKDTLLFKERVAVDFKGFYELKQWRHTDFIFSKYAKEKVYEKTLTILNELK